MRIQHNIMAMNAYRNYNLNTKALSGNLEKLSSGYKINRAGDDAAGLAISEKMRAQITGLNAAQKNVKDGISLVKTAEGAMQEIQDMLNRMDYLATQSANGTYDNEVDRANLQKEVENLKTEINRIADSANFNGIKLLDGSLDANAKAVTETVTTTTGGKTDVPILQEVATDPTAEVGTKTVLRGKTTQTGKAEVNMALHDLDLKGQDGDSFKITVGDAEIELTVGATENTSTGVLEAGKNYSGSDLANMIVAAFGQGSGQIGGQTFTAALGADGNSVKFTQAADPNSASEVVDSANLDVKVEHIENPAGNPMEYTVNIKDTEIQPGASITIGDEEVQIDQNLANTFPAAGKNVGGYIVKYDAAKNALSIKDENGTLGKPEVTYDAHDKAISLAKANVTTTDGVAAVTAAKATYTSQIATSGTLETGNTITIDGTTYTIIDAATTASGNNVHASTVTASWIASKLAAGTAPSGFSMTASGDTITYTADNAGAIGGDGPTAAPTAATVTVDKGTATSDPTFAVTAGAITEGTKGVDAAAATKTTAAYDLSDWELQDGDIIQIGNDKWVYDTDLATTLASKAANDGSTVLSAAIATAAGGGSAATVSGNTITVTHGTAGAGQTLTDIGIKVLKQKEDAAVANVKEPTEKYGMTGTYNVQTTNHKDGGYGSPSPLASTTFDLTADMVKDGNKLTIGKETYVFKIGADSTVKAGKGETLIDLSDYEAGDADLINAAGKGLADQTPGNDAFTIGFAKDSGKISIHEKQGQTVYDKELQSVSEFDKLVYMEAPEVTTSEEVTTGKDGKPLTLQIGDTSESFNQMKVSVGDMHTSAMGTGEYVDENGETVKVEKTIADVDIGNQEGAAEAVQVIKNAINYVSSVRGDLGAIQNRLDHTANNLSVMAENIQDAESTIRDTDVAEEMMSYVKNNILVQSAQAMLAQANQVPQGVLQLLG